MMHTFKANQWGFTFYSPNPKQDAETGDQDLHEKRNRLQLAQNKFYLG